MPYAVRTSEPASLLAAVCALFDARAAGDTTHTALPSAARLRALAEGTVKDGESDESRRFQGLLELGYLVASADGLADVERAALSELLERVTGRAVDREQMRVHFADLDAACDALGRLSCVARASAEFGDDTARKEALGFAALVALADGGITEPEIDQLVQLGVCFGMDEETVRGALTSLVAELDARLDAKGAR